MNFEEIMQTINNLTKEQLQQLQDAVVKKQEEKEKVFKPKEGEKYWYIDKYGNVRSAGFLNYESSCRWDILSGNCYYTKEKAEFARQKKLIEVELQRFADEHNEEIDWENKYTQKYCIGVNYCNKEVHIYFTYTLRENVVYFSSKELAEQAIAHIGEDCIKKYIFGVEE